jgi:hypothetical protein
MREDAGKAITLFEGMGYNGGIELLPVTGSKWRARMSKGRSD